MGVPTPPHRDHGDQRASGEASSAIPHAPLSKKKSVRVSSHLSRQSNSSTGFQSLSAVRPSMTSVLGGGAVSVATASKVTPVISSDDRNNLKPSQPTAQADNGEERTLQTSASKYMLNTDAATHRPPVSQSKYFSEASFNLEGTNASINNSHKLASLSSASLSEEHHNKVAAPSASKFSVGLGLRTAKTVSSCALLRQLRLSVASSMIALVLGNCAWPHSALVMDRDVIGQIVEAMGGTLTLKREKGRNGTTMVTTFAFTVPAEMCNTEAVTDRHAIHHKMIHKLHQHQHHDTNVPASSKVVPTVQEQQVEQRSTPPPHRSSVTSQALLTAPSVLTAPVEDHRRSYTQLIDAAHSEARLTMMKSLSGELEFLQKARDSHMIPHEPEPASSNGSAPSSSTAPRRSSATGHSGALVLPGTVLNSGVDAATMATSPSNDDRALDAAKSLPTMRFMAPLNLRVLVVDDEKSIRKLTQRMLDKLGCMSVLLEDGDELTWTLIHAGYPTLHGGRVRDSAAAAGQQFDVILLDIMMTRSNGVDVVVDLRKEFGTHVLPPIVAMTANATLTDIAMYKKAGFAAVLSKPFDLSSLRTTILQATSDTVSSPL